MKGLGFRGKKLKRVTEQMKAKMRRLRNSGLAYEKIARELGVSYGCVRYWLNPKFRKQILEDRKTYQEREYMKRYIMNRYYSDPEFRRQYLNYIRKYQTKIKMRNRGIRIPKKSLLACPRCNWRWITRVDHIPVHCPHCRYFFAKLPKVVSLKGNRGILKQNLLG